MARYGDTVLFDNRQKGQAMEALEQELKAVREWMRGDRFTGTTRVQHVGR